MTVASPASHPTGRARTGPRVLTHSHGSCASTLALWFMHQFTKLRPVASVGSMQPLGVAFEDRAPLRAGGVVIALMAFATVIILASVMVACGCGPG